MSAVAQALYARLAGDAALTVLLSTYEGTPAIFTGKLVPEDADRPYLWIPAAMTDQPFDTKIELGRDTEREVWVVCDNAGSMAPVETIAERVRALLHRAAFPISGGSVIIAEARGPVGAPSDDSVAALRVSVRLVYNVS